MSKLTRDNDLISRDELLKKLDRIERGCARPWNLVIVSLKEIVLKMPAIDAVQVVQCKDCKFYVKGSCNLHSIWADEYSSGYDCRPDDDDFCSLGERKPLYL